MGLAVSELCKSYGEKTVVDHLSFEIKEPGVYALLGTNGAGKTTSIRMILGMLSSDGGSVTWNGRPLTRESCNVGYLAEERGLYPKNTVADQLLYFAALRGLSKAQAKERVTYWARRLEAEEYLSGKGKKARKADELSKGNQQKIQFIAALLSDPDLLVLDEPFSGLDPVNTDLFKSVVREEIEKGKYLIMSSHQMATIEEFCTDLTILSAGKSVLQGNLAQIKKSRGRTRLFLKADTELKPFLEEAGVRILSSVGFSYRCEVTGQTQADELLRRLVARDVPLVSFDLREPSLHEIFVETVGDAHED